jgi:hypothetical protein
MLKINSKLFSVKIFILVIQLFYRGSKDYTPEDYGLIPDKCKRFSPLQNVQTGSWAQTALFISIGTLISTYGRG